MCGWVGGKVNAGECVERQEEKDGKKRKKKEVNEVRSRTYSFIDEFLSLLGF